MDSSASRYCKKRKRNTPSSDRTLRNTAERKKRQRAEDQVKVSIAPVGTKPSSSMASFDIKPLVLFDEEYSNSQPPMESCKYNLTDIANHYHVNSEGLDNDALTRECLHSILGKKRYYIERGEIPGMRSLPAMYTTIQFVPDNVVYESEDKVNVVTIAETHSSPILQTENKAVFCGSDLLRFLRFTDSSISEITVFFFPKREVKSCITAINIQWNMFRFFYSKEHLSMVDGCERFRLVVDKQQTALPNSDYKRFLMPLTHTEMKDFTGEENVRQLESRYHFMMSTETKIFKVVHNISEEAALLNINNAILTGKKEPELFISPVSRRTVPAMFSYQKVHFDPLREDAAKKCVKTLALKFKAALDELHSYGFLHNDVRLPNFCFDLQLNAILVDLDRCTDVGSRYGGYVFDHPSSCMYKLDHNLSGKQLDFFQLGWLLISLLEHTDNYHNRCWEGVNSSVKEDKFIEALILEGKFDESLLERSKKVEDAVELGELLKK